LSNTGGNVWGVDFGTTTTFLSASELANQIFPLGDIEAYMPSLAGFVGDNLIYGDATNGLTEDERLRSVKQYITRNKSCRNSETETAPIRKRSGEVVEVLVDDIIVGLLKTLRRKAEPELSQATTRLGCPAMWNGKQRARLLRLADRAGLKVEGSTLIDEPIAACISWVEKRRNSPLEDDRYINGNVLVFDMGGGTLDIAIIAVDAAPGIEPSLKVLASIGVNEAGDALDKAIADYLMDELSAKLDERPDLQSAIAQQKGTLTYIARLLKQDLSRAENAIRTLTLPNFEELEVELSKDELSAIFRPQSNRALTEIDRAIRNAVMVQDNISYKQAEEYPRTYLHSQISHVLLAGGMSKMPLVADNLVASGFKPSVIEWANDKHPDQAIALGLGTDQIYDHLNLHLPSFSFILEWQDLRTGLLKKLTIYEAHSELYPTTQRHIESPPKFRWHSYPERFPPAMGWIKAVSVDGKEITFRIDGNATTRIMFEMGCDSDGLGMNAGLTLSRFGEITINDGINKMLKGVIKGWPILRSDRRREISIKTEGYDPTSSDNLPYGIKESD
jgi:hypothetical protein